MGEKSHSIPASRETLADRYFSLPPEERQAWLGTLSTPALSHLTSQIKSIHQEKMREGERRLAALSARTLHTPAYIIDASLVEENMRLLSYVKERTGCKILHALKAFATTGLFPFMSPYVDGTCASGVHEARLGHEIFGKEVHTFSAAYREDEFSQVIEHSQIIIFNSFSQLEKLAPPVQAAKRGIGMRVNPRHPEVKTEMYNPCAPRSRLGVTPELFNHHYPPYQGIIEGLHFHVLCEQGADVLERVLAAFTHHFGTYFRALKWVNFGGGHHITREDYDVEKLCSLLTSFRQAYGLDIYLEPGEANVLNTGVLIASVLDIVENEGEIAILDTSAEAHMPDVLLMPYRPHIIGSGMPGEKRYTYRIAGPTCLAGDVMGDYSFDHPLIPGDRVVFTDMAHYSIVKNTAFNGINLPDIALLQGDDLIILQRFGYDDYRRRLG